MDDTDTPSPEPSPAPPAAPAAHHSDVLCYVRTGGPLALSYYRPTKSGVGGVQMERVRLVPGLSVCPAAHWPMLADVAQGRREAGEIKIVAGANARSLVDDWKAAKPLVLVEYLKHTHDVATLQRLHEIEAESGRLDVQDAIREALKRVEHLVSDAAEARRHKRSKNRAVR